MFDKPHTLVRGTLRASKSPTKLRTLVRSNTQGLFDGKIYNLKKESLSSMDIKKEEVLDLSSNKTGLPFSRNYAEENQRVFTEAVLQAEFKKALAALEQMPLTEHPVGKVERLITLVEGYKIIADMFYHNHKTKDQQEELIKELKEKLFYYENMGNPDDLMKKLRLLDEYTTLGAPDEIKQQLANYAAMQERLRI